MIKRNRKRYLLLTVFCCIAIIYLGYQSPKYIALYRLSKFKNLNITIATTKTMKCSRGCKIFYTYNVEGQVYGGISQRGALFRYPNGQYYVLYSTDNPTLQIILPEYNVNAKINIDTLRRDYLLKRLMHYSKTQAKEDWGWRWNDLFEVKEK